jgi:hypothetical protein
VPSAERYAQYRADQTTIWASKRAAQFLLRERASGESTAAAVDRLLGELRALRRRGAAPRPGANAGKKAGAQVARATGAQRGGRRRGRRAAKAATGRTGTRAGRGARRG